MGIEEVVDFGEFRRLVLGEAQYSRDKEIRDRAERLFDDLMKYLDADDDKVKQRLTPTRDGGFAVMAGLFSSEEDPPIIGIRFMPDMGRGITGALGKAGNTTVLVLPVLIHPGDVKYLHSRLSGLRNVFVHEMAHFFNPGRGTETGSARIADFGGTRAYYNTPSEWNSFWHEGAMQFERFLKTVGKNQKAFEKFYGDGGLKDVLSRVDKFWSQDFLDNMSSETRRKFDKRFAELWSQLKAKGLLGDGDKK